MAEQREDVPLPDRYTLEEARKELARQDCLVHGHDYEVIATYSSDGGPSDVICSRCGRAWAVAPAADLRPGMPGRTAIEVVLSCEADGCQERLRVSWPRDEYTCLLSGEQLGGNGSLTLDGAAPVPTSASKWRVRGVRREYRVRCPAHAQELG